MPTLCTPPLTFRVTPLSGEWSATRAWYCKAVKTIAGHYLDGHIDADSMRARIRALRTLLFVEVSR